MSISSTASSTAYGAQSSPVMVFAGRTATCLSLASLGLVVLLHFIKPEFEPSWRFLSEYAVGNHGWVMGVAFFTLSLACAFLFVALRKEARGISGVLGLLFLLTATVGLCMAAFYAMDPITIDPSQATETGKMHAISGMIGIPSMPLCSLLLSFSLRRRHGWTGVKAVLFWSAGLTLGSLVVMFIVIGTLLPQHGGFGPAVIVGWPNRLLMLAFYVWVATAGWQAAKLGKA